VKPVSLNNASRGKAPMFPQNQIILNPITHLQSAVIPNRNFRENSDKKADQNAQFGNFRVDREPLQFCDRIVFARAATTKD
jgi:hypothetical protein